MPKMAIIMPKKYRKNIVISSGIAIFSDVSKRCNILLSRYIVIQNAQPWSGYVIIGTCYYLLVSPPSPSIGGVIREWAEQGPGRIIGSPGTTITLPVSGVAHPGKSLFFCGVRKCCCGFLK